MEFKFLFSYVYFLLIALHFFCIKDRVIEEIKTTLEKKEWDTKDYCSFAKDLITFESLSYCDFVSLYYIIFYNDFGA